MPGSKKAMGIGLGILGGVLAGAVVGLLYAPKRGEETRKMVKEKAINLGNRAKESASTLMRPGAKSASVESNSAPWSEDIIDTTGDPYAGTEMESRALPVPRPLEIQTGEAAHPRPRASRRVRSASSLRTAARVTPEILPRPNANEETVVDSTGKEIGKLEGVMLDTESGQIAYGVIALEEGAPEERMCAVPWPALKESGQNRYTLEIAPERMEKAITFARGNLPSQVDLDEIDAMYDYYGYKNYWQKKRERPNIPPTNIR